MYVRGYLQGNENGRVVTIDLQGSENGRVVTIAHFPPGGVAVPTVVRKTVVFR